jgi:hypothetical protein
LSSGVVVEVAVVVIGRGGVGGGGGGGVGGGGGEGSGGGRQKRQEVRARLSLVNRSHEALGAALAKRQKRSTKSKHQIWSRALRCAQENTTQYRVGNSNKLYI